VFERATAEFKETRSVERCKAVMRWDTAWHRDGQLSFAFTLAHEERFLQRL